MKMKTNYFAVLMAAFLFVIFFAGLNPLPAVAEEKSPPAASASKATAVERTDARIIKMHSSLKITPAQEELWNALTEVMLDNAENLDKLTKARDDKTKHINAVEDLKLYSQILDSNAEGMKKFIAAFEGLYNSMSDEQKKNADVVFETHRHGRSKGK